MNGEFVIEKVAIHMVDKALPAPDFSQVEVKLANYSPENRNTILAFLLGHVEQAWQAEEGRKTHGAKFDEGSPMRQYYEELARNPKSFFRHSRDMAQRLYDVTPGNASRGLLLVMWIGVQGDTRPFMGLFKMDPGRRDNITLERDEAGRALLQIAVQHVEMALPDSSERVLKWAIVPHPVQAAFDLRIRDEQQSTLDPAAYFMTFLGCQPRPSEKQQTKDLLRVIDEYGDEFHPEQDWKPNLQRLVDDLAIEAIITPEVVTRKVRSLKTFKGFREDAFTEKLVASKAIGMRARPQFVRAAKLRYELPSSIVIKGPVAAMASLVRVESVEGGFEFRITTPSYNTEFEA